MTITVKLAGFRELEKALAELPKATGKSVLRKVAKGALQPLADDAEARAPVGSGLLELSMTVSEKRTRRAKTKGRVTFAGGKFRADRATGITMAMGPAGGFGALSYATFVEFGTEDTAAQAFMRPAWDAGAEQALDHVKTHLGAEIDKAAARVAKRRAKAGR